MENKNLTKQMHTWKEQLLDIGKCFFLLMYIQFDSYALAADLASDARLQCSSVMRGCIDLPLCFGSFTVTVVTSYRGLTMVSPSLQPPYQGGSLGLVLIPALELFSESDSKASLVFHSDIEVSRKSNQAD